MDDKIAELSLEQLHHDLIELKEVMNSLPQVIADNLPEAVNRKHMEVTVKNPTESVKGEFTVTNDINATVKNISEVTAKLDAVIDAVQKSSSNEVLVKNSVVVNNLSEISELLEKLLKKDTEVIVKAPVVKTPDSVKVNNWPDKADKPIAVRLSDGKRFINQLQQIIAGGGGVQSTLTENESIRITTKIYKKLIDDSTTANVTYIGEAALGSDPEDPSWRIKKIDESSGVSITWAGASFNTAWTDRVGATYS